KARIDFPLERMTGIRSRRMAGDREFAIDLAAKAAGECLSRSERRAGEIHLLISCNLSRDDRPPRVSLEPTTAPRPRTKVRLVNALASDISNACAGTFTAISLADSLIRQGAAKKALVVSGEYITHLARTAQLEIENFMDPRMACLTLGDSGVALLLEQAATEG